MADLQSFGLYLVMTDPLTGYEHCARAAVDCGVRMLQLRMKNVPDAECTEMARRVRAITVDSETLFIVNDRVDIAIEVDADGVHLGQDDLPITEARNLWPAKGKIFGLSTHNMEQALAAKELQPDYIGIGPIFPTPTKDIPDPTVELRGLKAIIAAVSLPSVAIGGINADNLPAVLSTGADNYAVVRAVNQSSDPSGAINLLQQIWRAKQG